MRRRRFLAILVATSVTSAFASEVNPKRVEIQLKHVYALAMPGTRDVRELPAARADGRIVESIRKALEPEQNEKQARRGFVVTGTGDIALRHAHGVLVAGEKPKARFPADEALSAVFFSYQSALYVHLDKVERQGFAFRISYRFVPHESGETTEHFALIPLGKLPPGRYSVRVEQNPMEKKYIDAGFVSPPKSAGEQQVSCTFHFVVE